MNVKLLFILLLFVTACGQDGKDGTDGVNGTPGIDGVDGNDGRDGDPGTVITILDPCGDDPGLPDEVILVMANGTYLAWYKNLGFTVLQEDTVYVTTDWQRCKFKINAGLLEEL